MIDPRDAAIHCEMTKYALRQSKDGIIVSFVLHPHEVPKDLQTADIGSRWMVALVELNDDETPKQPAKELPVSEPHSGRASWRDLTPTTQAAIRCADPVFRKFLTHVWGSPILTENDAAEFIRISCGIKSRTELSLNRKAALIWRNFDDKFQAWKLADAPTA